MIKYLLKGHLDDDPSTWRVTYEENSIQHGWARKMGREVVPEEIVLIRLEMDGTRGVHNLEDRRRKVLWRARSRLEAILATAEDDTARDSLPIVIHFSSREEEDSQPGYLSQLVDRALARFAQACEVGEGGALPRPLKEPKKYGTKTWMGLAVPHVDDAVPASVEKSGRGAMILKPHWPEEEEGGALRALPLQGLACVLAPLGMCVVEGCNVGRPVEMQCVVQRPGTGRLLITGNISPEVERCAELSLCLLRLHSQWLTDRFGPFRTLTPGDATADLRLHMCMVNNRKVGTSFAAALTVTLAAVHLGCGVVPHVGVTGRITLSGPIGGVAGLAEKIRGAHRWFKDASPGDGKIVRVIVPSENVRGKSKRSWQVVEERDLFSGHLAVPIELERKLVKEVEVVPVRSVFELLALCLVPPDGGHQAPLLAPFPIAPPSNLSLAHALLTDDGRGSGALPQVVECAFLKPGTGAVTYHSNDAQPKEGEAIDVVLYWLKSAWGRIAAEWGRGVAQDPTLRDYDLHIHLPGLRRDARVAVAAGVALLSLFLGLAVPRAAELAFIGEVQLNGDLVREATPRMHAHLLAAAKANGRLQVYASAEAALQFQKVLSKRRASLEGVGVVGTRNMMEVFRKVFLQQTEEA